MNIEHVVIIFAFIMLALIVCTAANTIILIKIRWLLDRTVKKAIERTLKEDKK